MLSVQDLSITFPNGDELFEAINFSVAQHQKVGIVGKNGVGKSTLLKCINGEFEDYSGSITRINPVPIYTLPQHYGQYNHNTIAEVLGIHHKLAAISNIERGSTSELDFETIQDDWDIENKAVIALQKCGLGGKTLNQTLAQLSGGEKSKLFLAGMELNPTSLLIMDEPTNHLDEYTRAQLYKYIEITKQSIVAVSHDRALLELCEVIVEITAKGSRIYGGNYSFYESVKKEELKALDQQIASVNERLKREQLINKKLLNAKQKQNSQAVKRHDKTGTDKILRNALKSRSEKTMSTLKSKQTKKEEEIRNTLNALKNSKSEEGLIKVNFENSGLHKGKTLISVSELNYAYPNQADLFKTPLTFEIKSGERIAISGNNGSGKSTLIKLITKQLQPSLGRVENKIASYVYIDQKYSMIRPKFTVYEQVQAFNIAQLPEHELKIRLNRFLFDETTWGKKCSALSGGETMRLALCCMMIFNQSPDLLILDEPTNNLDRDNLEILTDVISKYKGTLLVVSHDKEFKSKLAVTREIRL